MKSFLVDQDGYYGEFGGAYVPEILHKCVEELTNKYLEVIPSDKSYWHAAWERSVSSPKPEPDNME